MTRTLLQAYLIKKTRKAGKREAYFVIKEGAWPGVLQSEMDLIFSMRKISEKGLELIEDEPETDHSRLAEMHDFYDFAASEMPSLIEKYRS